MPSRAGLTLARRAEKTDAAQETPAAPLNEESRRADATYRETARINPFFTVGHSTRTIVTLVDLLRETRIELLADV